MSAIQSAARDLQRDYPRLAPGSYVSPDARDALRDIAARAGMSLAAASLANDTDLLSVYRVALSGKDDVARRTAAKVAARVAPNGPQRAPMAPAPAPDAPRDTAPGISPADLMRAVRDATDPIRDALDDKLFTVAADMRETLSTLARDAAAEAVKRMTPTQLEITRPDTPPLPIGLVHKDTARVIRYLSRGLNVYLYGPAGSGKTTLAAKVAKAFGVQDYYAAKVEHEYQLLGFINAQGYVSTEFRRAYEFGGVFLFDEFDASASVAVVALNMALANKKCAFPDATIDMHPDFRCIAAGNTCLRGATEEYNGRNELDGASVNRFVFVEFGYDNELERAIAPNADWAEYVMALRAAVKERGLNVLITPRATLDGAECIASGDDWLTAAHASIFKGLEPDTCATLMDAASHAWKG